VGSGSVWLLWWRPACSRLGRPSPGRAAGAKKGPSEQMGSRPSHSASTTGTPLSGMSRRCRAAGSPLRGEVGSKPSLPMAPPTRGHRPGRSTLATTSFPPQVASTSPSMARSSPASTPTVDRHQLRWHRDDPGRELCERRGRTFVRPVCRRGHLVRGNARTLRIRRSPADRSGRQHRPRRKLNPGRRSWHPQPLGSSHQPSTTCRSARSPVADRRRKGGKRRVLESLSDTELVRRPRDVA
jgi:hypothetical protein